jgi:hypothetical protein
MKPGRNSSVSDISRRKKNESDLKECCLGKILQLLVIISLTLIALTDISFADTVSCHCYCNINIPAPCGDEDCKRACGWRGPSSSGGAAVGGVYQPLYGLGYNLGYAFGQWLFGSDSNPQAEYQKQQMMAELRRRQAEAERQRQEEEARRLAAMYNRLSAKLKLSGLPNLQMKDLENKSAGLKLKLGDNVDGHAGVKGLPGIYLNDGKTPYGVAGLPGIYTGGPRQGSELTDSKLALKMGDSNSPPPTQKTFDPSKMTTEQLADVAEMVSKLPPEEQERIFNASQKSSASSKVTTVTDNPSSLAVLQRQSAASREAAGAPVDEDASMKARVGFDQPFGSTPMQYDRFDHQGHGLSAPEAHPNLDKAATAASTPASSLAPIKQNNQEHESTHQNIQQIKQSGNEMPNRLIPIGEEKPQTLAKRDQQLEKQNRQNTTLTLKHIKRIDDPAGSEKFKTRTEKLQKGWWKALGCAMEEVYARAESFGPTGAQFSNDLRREIKRVFNEAGEEIKDKDDVNIVNLKLERQVSVGSGSRERQFIVEATVHSKGNGNIDVDVQSYFSKSAGKKDRQENLQSIFVLNKSGEVIMNEYSSAVEACLSH